MDHLAKRLSEEIAKAGIGSVVVADFLNADGSTLRQGFYLAEELSQRLDHHSKKQFVVLDRHRLCSALSDAHLSTKDLTSVDSLQRVRDSLQTDGVVTGTVEVLPSQYSLNVSLRTLKDGSVVGSDSQLVKRPGYADTLLLYSSGSNETIRKPGVDGVSIPTCEACSLPTYTDKARAAKIQANVQLLVVINQEGRATRIEVTRSSDDGLARKAIEAVRSWKFKPARDKEGHTVAVVVPIEVNFRLY